LWREDNLPYLAAAGNHPIGANHFNTMSKRHAKVFGFTNWRKNTSHGKRSKGVTAIHAADGVGAGTKHRVSRHKNFDTSVGYDRGTTRGEENAILALMGPQPLQSFRPSINQGTYYFRALIATFL